MSAAPGLARRLGDRALSRLWQLPAPGDYTVDRRVRIPMRDGVELLADHYRPDTDRPAGTVLVRGPYGRSFPTSAFYASVYAARGYHVVLQSVRGTSGSGGEFDPMVNEAADGADTAAWLRDQPWFTGRFATVGVSYLGYTQWALLADPPPELATAVVIVGLHDLATATWGTGAFTLTDSLGWSELVALQQNPSRLRMTLGALTARRRLRRASAELPLGVAGRTLLGAGAPWYESWLEPPDTAEQYWSARQARALDRVDVPVLLVGGWQDVFLDQTLEQYRRLRDRGVDVGLTVGAWAHRDLTAKAGGAVARESLQWLDTHLAGGQPRARSRVRVDVVGQGWTELTDWPPPMDALVLHLQPGGGLAETSPPPTAAPSSFRYDPTDPTPTVGGRLLDPVGGYRNDDGLARRGDVLSFTGEVLTTDLFVLGSPVVELAHRTDNPNVDLFVRISEVDARGRSRNVSDGYRRLTTASTATTGMVRLELDAIAHRFPAGSRIRVLVAGGSYPRYARNPGTGEPAVTATGLVAAVHLVHHGSGGASRVTLPAGDRLPPG